MLMVTGFLYCRKFINLSYFSWNYVVGSCKDWLYAPLWRYGASHFPIIINVIFTYIDNLSRTISFLNMMGVVPMHISN